MASHFPVIPMGFVTRLQVLTPLQAWPLYCCVENVISAQVVNFLKLPQQQGKCVCWLAETVNTREDDTGNVCLCVCERAGIQ